MCVSVDAIRIADQEHRGVLAGDEGCLVAIPDTPTEPVAAQVAPDALHRIEFGRVGRPWQQRDVLGDTQSPALPVPTAASRTTAARTPYVAWMLISTRCSVVASGLITGIMIAAPRLRAWQVARNKQAGSRRLTRSICGREPICAACGPSLPSGRRWRV